MQNAFHALNKIKPKAPARHGANVCLQCTRRRAELEYVTRCLDTKPRCKKASVEQRRLEQMVAKRWFFIGRQDLSSFWSWPESQSTDWRLETRTSPTSLQLAASKARLVVGWAPSASRTNRRPPENATDVRGECLQTRTYNCSSTTGKTHLQSRLCASRTRRPVIVL